MAAKEGPLDGALGRLSGAITQHKLAEENKRLVKELEDMKQQLKQAKQDNYCSILEKLPTKPEEVIKRLNQRRIRLPLDGGVVDVDSLKFAAILEEAGCLGTVMQKIEALVAAEPPIDPLLPIIFNDSALRVVGNALVNPDSVPSYSPHVAEKAMKDYETARKKKEEVYDELRQLAEKLEQNLNAAAAVMQEKMTKSMVLAIGKFKEVVAKIRHDIGHELVDLTDSRGNSDDAGRKKKSNGNHGESSKKKSTNDADGVSPKKRSNDGKENKDHESKSSRGDGGEHKNKAREKSTSEKGGGAKRSASGAKNDDDEDVLSKGKIRRLG